MSRRKKPHPLTLVQAHEELFRQRPDAHASPDQWLRFYQRSAEVYAEVAEIDRGHHHEALYWAGRERQRAQKIEEQLSKS